ncbi:MAG TPA: hypothetical protein VF520_06040 [Thermoleophilaceae bacterium]|jgi:hypothetical protein
MGEQHLIVRGADLLVVGVRWSGFTVGGGRLVAGPGGAQLVLTFPPQAIGEERYAQRGDVSTRRARVSGSSQLVFQVAGGTEFDLDAEGVLAALAAEAQKVVRSAEGESTAVELPWRLTVAPQSLSGADVVYRHSPSPVDSGAGVVGAWYGRLLARDGSALDAGLAVVPLGADQDDEDLDVDPLNGPQRQMVVDAATQVLPRARRLELGALGGSLSARVTTPTFEWDHDATHGRDHRVRVAMKGVLYPFGHRAEYSVVGERIFDPDGTTTVAGVHREQLLVVTEPVRSTADGPLELVRRFPFREVEIVGRTYTDLAPDDFKGHRRTRVPDDDLLAEIAGHEEEMKPLVAVFQAEWDTLPHDFDTYMAMEFGLAGELNNAVFRESLDPNAMQREREALIEERRQLQLAIDPPPPPPPPPDEFLPPPTLGQGLTTEERLAEVEGLLATDFSEANIQRVRNEEAFWDARVPELRNAIANEIEAMSTVDKLIASRESVDSSAVRIRELREAIAAVNERIRLIAEAAEVPHPVRWLPATRDGRPLRFVVRCAAASGDVFMSVPMVFVRDFQLEGDHFEPFDALTDAEVAAAVAAQWREAADQGNVALPGTRIDMVASGSPEPPPGDVHEVHVLSLDAVPEGRGFRPKVTGFEVELPALRALAPGAGGRRVLDFSRSFLEQDAIPETPLVLRDPVGVDFTTAADRAGGLVSPKFAADRISRELGPIAAGALPRAPGAPAAADLPPFDLASTYRGATLLGFPLASLIDLPTDLGDPAKLPSPPAFVQLSEGGVPSAMRMDWTLDLRTHGPFRPKPGTKLLLSATVSQEKRETTCTVNDFELVLPPSGAVEGLLTLGFRKLAFTQHEGRAPDLAIEGLTVGFGGALKLLQGLQEKLQALVGLPETRPTVEVRPTGLTAGYGLAVPSVPAGGFLIKNISMRVAVDVPFDGKPVAVTLSFATRDDPFNVSVLAFGGGGYIDLTLGPEGLARLEASIDFGASIEVDFFVAKGEVHAIGGVRFAQSAGTIEIDGFLRIGGSVEVLGLVSVSIELLVTLSYRSADNRLVGRAKIVVEIDLTLFSDSVEIDSGEWVLAGGSGGPTLGAGPSIGRPVDPLAEWRRYREAFAPA